MEFNPDDLLTAFVARAEHGDAAAKDALCAALYAELLHEAYLQRAKRESFFPVWPTATSALAYVFNCRATPTTGSRRRGFAGTNGETLVPAANHDPPGIV